MLSSPLKWQLSERICVFQNWGNVRVRRNWTEGRNFRDSQGKELHEIFGLCSCDCSSDFNVHAWSQFVIESLSEVFFVIFLRCNNQWAKELTYVRDRSNRQSRLRLTKTQEAYQPKDKVAMDTFSRITAHCGSTTSQFFTRVFKFLVEKRCYFTVLRHLESTKRISWLTRDLVL